MGRLLDIARDTERATALLDVLPVPPYVDRSPITLLPLISVPPRPEIPFDALVADVLDILVKARRPVLHSGTVKALVARGYDKVEANQAIARCQHRGWIQHNLVTGYVLSQEDGLSLSCV